MIALFVALIFAHCVREKTIEGMFTDNFDRQVLGDDYRQTGGPYRLESGMLRVKGAYNKPLWLARKLPRNALIEFSARSDSPSGDIKIEAWGDGRSAPRSRGAYLATSYVFVLGGWHNTISVLARLDEHGPDRIERRDFKVTPGKTYRIKIRRQGSTIEWFVDGKRFAKLDDHKPLEGAQHRFFAFNNWNSDVTFDQLKITQLPAKP